VADPHIHSPMDSLDYFTVVVYRFGLTLMAPALVMLVWKVPFAEFLIFVAATCCASCLHIYVKKVRFMLQMVTWGGLLIALSGATLFGLGGAMMTMGGLAFKEQLCFRIPGLRWQPVLLFILWFLLLFHQKYIAEIIGSVSSALFLILAVAKWRMPLHYDIGDKSKYEQ